MCVSGVRICARITTHYFYGSDLDFHEQIFPTLPSSYSPLLGEKKYHSQKSCGARTAWRVVRRIICKPRKLGGSSFSHKQGGNLILNFEDFSSFCTPLDPGCLRAGWRGNTQNASVSSRQWEISYPCSHKAESNVIFIGYLSALKDPKVVYNAN